MSSLEGLPASNPYPWGPYDYQISESKGRKRRGTGITFLQSAIKNDGVNESAAKILKALMPELADVSESEVYPIMLTSSLGNYIPRPMQSSQSEDEILNLARSGKVSLFASLLKLTDDASPVTVPSKTMIRSCILTVRPGAVPASMDAKDFVLSALFFLSQVQPSHSKAFLDLPLLRLVGITEDLEKRSYEKAWTWNLTPEFLKKVGILETAFLESASNWQDLPRGHMVPSIPKEDERTLLYKGNIPLSATPKTKKGTMSKRKTELSLAPTNTSDIPISSQKSDLSSSSW